MKKRILSMICALALCLGLLPTTVFAADGDKAIMLGTNGISGYDDSTNSYDYIYFGNWEAPDEYTTTGPIKWRVLDDQTNTEGTGLFLLSDGLFGQGNKYGGGVRFRQDRTSNAWQGSDAQKWCRDFYGSSFSTGEQGAVLATTKTDAAYKATSVKPPIDFLGSELEGDTVFFLSAEEVENKAYGFIDNAARRAYFGNTGNWGAWWLRSPDKLTSTVAGTITRSPTSSAGSLSGNFVNNDSYTARPAFNLNLDDVLFTSAAVGGKSASGMESGLTAVDAYDGSEWKLTLLDDSRVFDVTETDISGDPGDTITLHYTGATTGDNEYISVILVAESSVQYYGRIAKATTEEGEISLTIPDTLAEGTYTLNVFNEQCNGDYKTDYASAFETFTLTVDITAPTLSAGSATRDSETTAIVKFTSDEAGTYYYVVAESGAETPDIDTTGTGTACVSGENTISLNSLAGAAAKDIYIVAKDAAGNVSDTLKIEISEFIPIYTISAEPTQLNFESKTVGYTEAPAAQTVTITNTGNQTVTVTLPTSTNYTITAGTGFANGTATLAPNGTAEFTVRPVTGLDADSHSETLTISSNHTTSAEVSLAFTVEPKSLVDAQVNVTGDYTYDGNEKKPSGSAVTVTLNDETLTESTDYELTYSNNVNAGTATVQVTGKGNYTGTATGSFTIAKANPNVEVPNNLTATYGDTLANVALPDGWSWDDPGTTPVGNVGNNTFSATYTPEDTGNYNMLQQSLTISVRSSGSSGGSSITTETTKNPDGSTTITVTNKVTGTVTETTKFPDGSKEVVETTKDGTVTTTTTDTAGNKTEVVENTDGSSQTTVTNKDGSGSVTVVDENGNVVSSATLSQSAVEAAQEKGEAVTLPMPEVPITTDRETAPTVTVDLPSGTTAKVEIPVADVTPGTVAILVNDDGTEEVIKTSLTTENGVAVTLSDGDTVKVVDNSKTFDDVADNYWGAEAVDFAVSRELFAGTSATTFAPDTAMTRAMIVTVLARFEGVDTTTGSTWYEAGQQWAMENGVSDGTNMDASLTREQLATMLYRYAQSKGYDTTQGGMAIREYADFEQISDYAVEAMTWAVNTGLISGTSTTTLSPQGLATRAQVATILMRFIEGMA